jgi:hypothetical protein
LSPNELAYINLQQEFAAPIAKTNLRTMTLAATITGAFSFPGTFEDLSRNNPQIRKLTLIEIKSGQELVSFP